jgi:[FeFe] hydrogenase H-cluster maturation GTPase HydF
VPLVEKVFNMYNTPVSNRLHIGIFGRRNVGKSSLINAITGQSLAIVSEIPGTTADPVYKSMEILPIGPCVLIDTAGIDDEGALGEKRVEKTRTVLRKTDVALMVLAPDQGVGKFEEQLFDIFKERKISFTVVINKCDVADAGPLERALSSRGLGYVKVSSVTCSGIEDLKKMIIEISPANWSPVPLLGDIIKPKDKVVLVCPVDSAMPQGRLILPQVQVLRAILDADAMAYVAKDSEAREVLGSMKEKPDLVITDSQVFETIKDVVPGDVPFTSFSIIYARHKGDLAVYLDGVKSVKELKDGDEVLISEACTHHVQPEDIGRTKIPTWLRNTTGKDIHFEVTAGCEFPENLSRFKLIIACGGCMVTRREMMARIELAKKAGVPITNYGIIIAYFAGVLERTAAPFIRAVGG